MSLNIFSPIAERYSSKSQKIRVMSEYWVKQYIFCPSCGKEIAKYPNNKPVADFYCQRCSEDYELKSKQGKIGKKISDGAYSTMIDRLRDTANPNFFFLSYHRDSLNILNFFVIPKHFFIPEYIEKREPLSSNAKRAGWTGCNILLDSIPESGKIFYIKNGKEESKEKVLSRWKNTLFLRNTADLQTKGWIIDIIYCIEKLNKEYFSLNDLYSFEQYLKMKHPNNNNIKAKIRQQLQILRDRGYLKFLYRGRYKIETI